MLGREDIFHVLSNLKYLLTYKILPTFALFIQLPGDEAKTGHQLVIKQTRN